MNFYLKKCSKYLLLVWNYTTAVSISSVWGRLEVNRSIICKTKALLCGCKSKKSDCVCSFSVCICFGQAPQFQLSVFMHNSIQRDTIPYSETVMYGEVQHLRIPQPPSQPAEEMGPLGSWGLPHLAVFNTPGYQSFFTLPSRLFDRHSDIESKYAAIFQTIDQCLCFQVQNQNCSLIFTT